MSSPISPLTDRIQRLRDLGSQALNAFSHPIDTMMHMGQSDPAATHQQGIDQINQQLNSHNNDAANKSFQHPNITTMKKPLGK